MRILYGKPISDEILADLKEKISSEGQRPGLAVFLIGKDEASRLYVNLKKKKAEEIGIKFFLYEFPEDSSQEEIISKILNVNEDKNISGIIVQLPLPDKFDMQVVIDSINIEKDVDGFAVGENQKLKPVFPKAILKMIEKCKNDIVGSTAISIVNSEKFGKAISESLKKEGFLGEYILSKDLNKEIEKIKKADIVISAIGKPGILKGEYFKEGAVVIDGGITKIGERVLGDVDLESAKNMDITLSPVPGGVGPVTIACLLENVYLAYENQKKYRY